MFCSASGIAGSEPHMVQELQSLKEKRKKVCQLNSVALHGRKIGILVNKPQICSLCKPCMSMELCQVPKCCMQHISSYQENSFKS